MTRWERLKFAYFSYKHPHLVEIDQHWSKVVVDLKKLQSHFMNNPIGNAINKVEKDTIKDNEERRRQALEWVGIYCEHCKEWDTWLTRFLLEYELGRRKGYF